MGRYSTIGPIPDVVPELQPLYVGMTLDHVDLLMEFARTFPDGPRTIGDVVSAHDEFLEGMTTGQKLRRRFLRAEQRKALQARHDKAYENYAKIIDSLQPASRFTVLNGPKRLFTVDHLECYRAMICETAERVKDHPRVVRILGPRRWDERMWDWGASLHVVNDLLSECRTPYWPVYFGRSRLAALTAEQERAMFHNCLRNVRIGFEDNGIQPTTLTVPFLEM